MTTLESRRSAMLARVRDFGEAHKDLFPKSTVAGQAFAAVAAALAQVKARTVSRMSQVGERQRTKTAARQALVEGIEAVSRTARAIAEDAPDFDASYRLPFRQTEQTLLAAARVFAHDAEASKASFVTHGLPRTFVEDLRALVDRFEKAISNSEAGKAAQASAQTGIVEALLDGMSAARKLDGIVGNLCRDNPEVLAEWERARRVEYPSRPSKRGLRAVAPAHPATTPLTTASPAPAAAPPSPAPPPAPVSQVPAVVPAVAEADPPAAIATEDGADVTHRKAS